MKTLNNRIMTIDWLLIAMVLNSLFSRFFIFFREIKTFVKTQIISFQKLLNAYTLIIVAWKYNIHNWYFIRNLDILLLKRT